ncbi:MAG: amidohydrolase family protein [Pseudomonadota bacterium]
MIKPLLALAAALSASAALADTLVSNVNGIQVGPDGKLQHFKALVFSDDGKVRQVIERPELVRLAGITTTIDGGGRTLLPGLIDAHGHVVDLGVAALTLDLVGTTSIADVQRRLAAYANERKTSGWLVGFGWNQEQWANKSYPTAADLDRVVGDRPVVLERVDGHAVVANSAALKAAGITAATTAPEGGKIERDAQGNPTGLFIDNARALVEDAIPARTTAQSDEALATAQERLLSFGVTAVGAMSTSASDLEAFRRAGDAGRLRVRLMSYMTATDAAATDQRPSGWLYNDRLRLVGVKLFADGALGSRGAWLKEPYADKPDTRGIPRHSDAELLSQADAAASRGFQIATHAIGDAGNEQVIKLYEQLAKKYPGDRRWRIEHFQIVDPVDIPRLKPAGIIASMQPTHQTSDRLMAEERLGPDRLKGAYAWQTVEKLGIPVAFGSDYPVESPNPFPGLSAAISRQDINGQPPGGWIPSERLSFAQALSAFTRGGAYAGFAEDKIGSLEPGKWADFIIVDRDPTAVDPQSLARTEVIETWVAGKKAWERAPSAASQPERGK